MVSKQGEKLSFILDEVERGELNRLRARNREIHPDTFEILGDDGQIAEIHATMDVVDSASWWYRIIVEER